MKTFFEIVEEVKNHDIMHAYNFENLAEYRDQRGTYDETLMHWFAQYDHCDLVEEMLASGYDVNAVDRKGRSPIFWAARAGCKDIVEVLLLSGADTNLVTKNGDNLLVEASGKRETLMYIENHQQRQKIQSAISEQDHEECQPTRRKM